MRTGLIVLSGSSGRVEHARAEVFAAHGLTTLALRWFGGPGQPCEPCEVPLETWTWKGRPLDFVPMDDAWAEERRHLAGPVALPPSPTFDHGGTPEADALLGARALPKILSALTTA